MRDWLRDSKNRKWRLILDNVDDASFLLDDPSPAPNDRATNDSRPASKRLVDFLPTCENGSILITTRNKGAALDLVEPYNTLSVEPMEQKEAEALIEAKLGPQQEKDSIEELAMVLECMPLAIVQATAYISRRAPQWSMQQYLEQFKQSDQRKAGLLHQEGGHLRRDGDSKNSILVTWQISFNHIQQVRPSAADLLSLMSFFDRQGIPESLIRDRRRARTDESVGRSRTFDEDILILQEYSFVNTFENSHHFRMHRLVQLATYNWLHASINYERWKQEFLYRLSAHLPPARFQNWAEWQMLLPHARLGSTLRPETEESILDWADVLFLLGGYLWQTGNGCDAERLLTIAMETQIEILGRHHEHTLDSMIQLALIYGLNGQYDAKEKLETEVLRTSKQQLGLDHPLTLKSRHNLSMTYTRQNRWEAAEKLQKESLKAHEQIFGPECRQTLASMKGLASTYNELGRLKAAVALLERILEIEEKSLGTNHRATLNTMHHLAINFAAQGHLEAAEELHTKIIKVQQQVLVPDHPRTLASRSGLAFIYSEQGRLDLAKSL